MTKKFPKTHTTSEAQEMFTPPCATDLIVPYLKPNKIIWECCYGTGLMAERLEYHNFRVIGHKKVNCLTTSPEVHFDYIVSNPPYRNNKKFMEMCLQTGKAFAMLIRLEHLGGVQAMNLYKDLDNITILIPKRRINFITPKVQQGLKVGGSPFHTIWFTSNLIKSKGINFKYIDYTKSS